MTRPSEMPPEARPGELSVRKKAVPVQAYPGAPIAYVTKMGVKPLALGASAVERQERARLRDAEVQAFAAQTAIEGAETADTAADDVWSFDRRDGFTGVTSPNGGVRTWVMQAKPTEGIEE